jgi:hypothetical protein
VIEVVEIEPRGVPGEGDADGDDDASALNYLLPPDLTVPHYDTCYLLVLEHSHTYHQYVAYPTRLPLSPFLHECLRTQSSPLPH